MLYPPNILFLHPCIAAIVSELFQVKSFSLRRAGSANPGGLLLSFEAGVARSTLLCLHLHRWKLELDPRNDRLILLWNLYWHCQRLKSWEHANESFAMISHRDVVRTLIACEFGRHKCMALWVTDSTSCRKKKRQKKQEAFNKDSARNESGGRSPEIGFRLTLAPASGRAVAKRVKEQGAFATSKGPHKDLVKPWDLQEMHFTRSQRRARYYCSRVIGCYWDINDVNECKWIKVGFAMFPMFWYNTFKRTSATLNTESVAQTGNGTRQRRSTTSHLETKQLCLHQDGLLRGNTCTILYLALVGTCWARIRFVVWKFIV